MVRRASLLLVLALAGFVLVLPGAAAGGGCHAPLDLEMSSSTNSRVGIGQCAFVDTVTYIDRGDSVTWFNKDPVPHTVSGAANSWGNENLLSQGDRVTYAFEKEGVYPYYCALHPTMVGAVVVGDATKAALLTNGVADVEQKMDPPASSEETTRAESDGEAFMSAGVGLSIVLVLAAVFAVWRLTLRRRASAASTS